MMRSAVISLALGLALATPLWGYPPATGVLSPAKTCLACHVNNGPWADRENTIIDVLDRDSGRSLRQQDGSFLIAARRGQALTVLTVIGRAKGDSAPAPYRNAWLYIDPAQIETSALSKFAPGWSVNLMVACRIVGDTVKGYEGAAVTALPMTLRPADDAQDAVLQLQVMLTRGDSVKGRPAEGMIGNYFERTVYLRVLD